MTLLLDQGLLYHWVKYEKRSVSIVSGVEVDNYGPKNDRERVRLEKTLKNPFKDHTCLPLKYEKTFGELPTFDARGMAPYRDFVHFLLSLYRGMQCMASSTQLTNFYFFLGGKQTMEETAATASTHKH